MQVVDLFFFELQFVGDLQNFELELGIHIVKFLNYYLLLADFQFMFLELKVDFIMFTVRVAVG